VVIGMAAGRLIRSVIRTKIEIKWIAQVPINIVGSGFRRNALHAACHEYWGTNRISRSVQIAPTPSSALVQSGGDRCFLALSSAPHEYAKPTQSRRTEVGRKAARVQASQRAPVGQQRKLGRVIEGQLQDCGCTDDRTLGVARQDHRWHAASATDF